MIQASTKMVLLGWVIVPTGSSALGVLLRFSSSSLSSLGDFSHFIALLNLLHSFTPNLWVSTPPQLCSNSIGSVPPPAGISASSSSLVFLFPALRTILGISSMCAKPTSPQSQGMSCSNVSSPDSSFRHRNPKREQNFHENFLVSGGSRRQVHRWLYYSLRTVIVGQEEDDYPIQVIIEQQDM